MVWISRRPRSGQHQHTKMQHANHNVAARPSHIHIRHTICGCAERWATRRSSHKKTFAYQTTCATLKTTSPSSTQSGWFAIALASNCYAIDYLLLLKRVIAFCHSARDGFVCARFGRCVMMRMFVFCVSRYCGVNAARLLYVYAQYNHTAIRKQMIYTNNKNTLWHTQLCVVAVAALCGVCAFMVIWCIYLPCHEFHERNVKTSSALRGGIIYI